MSRFTGPQYRGAAKAAKEIRREEAEARNAAFAALSMDDLIARAMKPAEDVSTD